jgi:hypothetical protein
MAWVMAKRAPTRNFPPLLFFGGIPDDRPGYSSPGREGSARNGQLRRQVAGWPPAPARTLPAAPPTPRRPGPRATLAPAVGDSPTVAALSALSAEPGGATVAVIAARTGISMPAVRQALLAHEKNGTPPASRAAGPASPTPGRPPRHWVGVPTTCGTRRSRCG